VEEKKPFNKKYYKTRWCMMRHDEDLRLLLVQKFRSHSRGAICQELELEVANVKNYLEGKDVKRISQYDLRRLAKRMGIKVGLKLELE
jgi:hypothetical protein